MERSVKEAVTDPPTACEDCDLAQPARRTFLRDSAMAVAGIWAALGVTSRVAEALPVWAVKGTRASGSRSTFHTYPIPATDGVQIDRDNQVIIVRWQGLVYAFALTCPHQNTALRWDDADSRFQCPKHHSKYQPNGTFIEGRATRNMDRLPITRDGNQVKVDIDTLIKSSDNPATWNAAVVKVGDTPAASKDTAAVKDTAAAAKDTAAAAKKDSTKH